MNSLRINQVDAINAYLQYFKDDATDRGIISMCCGSGKTRTTYEIVKLTPGNVFIIVTSRLLLIDQIKSEFAKWIKLERLNYAIFINATGGHGMEKSIVDIQYRCFMGQPTIIISTYKSLKKISDLFIENNISVNLIIYDEAHNTVGKDGKEGQVMINPPDGLIVYRQLFMTATPVAFFKYCPDSDMASDETVYSMCNEDTYGKLIYKFTLKDGVNHGIITDWDVYTLSIPENLQDSVVGIFDDLDTISNKQRYLVGINFLADQIQSAIQKYNLSNLITYVKNTTEANDLYKVIKKNTSINSVLIHSEIPDKSKTLKTLTGGLTPKKQVVIAVSMLDEGVDIPSCDSVLFAHDCRQENIIIQRIGRALRISSNKIRAKIFIPGVLAGCGDIVTSKAFEKTRHVISELNENTKSFCVKYSKLLPAKPPVETIKCDYIPQPTDTLDDVSAKIIDDLSNIVEMNKSDPNRIANLNLEKITTLIKATNIDTVSDLYKMIENLYGGANIIIHDMEGFISYTRLFERPTATIHEFVKIINSDFKDCIKRPFRKWQAIYIQRLTDAIGKPEESNLYYIPRESNHYYGEYVADTIWPFNEEVHEESHECAPAAQSDETTSAATQCTILDQVIMDIKINDVFQIHKTAYSLTPVKVHFNNFSINISVRIMVVGGRIRPNQTVINTFSGNKKCDYSINITNRQVKPRIGCVDGKPSYYISSKETELLTLFENIKNEIAKQYGIL